MLVPQSFPGSQLFTFEQSAVIPGNPDWANLNFKALGHQAPQDFNGPGIYMIFFDGAPVYLGKYLGQKTNVFGGRVHTVRWDKHLGTLTSRGRKLSVAKRSLEEIRVRLSQRHELDQSENALLSGLCSANAETLIRDRGCVSSVNRFLFSAQNWPSFSNLQTTDLARFNFLYVRISEQEFGQRTIQTDQQVRRAVSRAEKRLISDLRPIGNRETTFGAHRCDYTENDAQAIMEAALRQELQLQDPVGEAEAEGAANGNPPVRTEAAHLDNDDERDSARERFFETIDDSPAAIGLIESLADLCEQLGVDVHHTFTEGGDLRVWCGSPIQGRRGLNLLAMSFKRTLGHFSAEVFLPLEYCIGLGNNQKRANHVGKKLPALIKVVPGVDDAAYLNIVEHSISQFRNQ